jgi:hypothetical protein
VAVRFIWEPYILLNCFLFKAVDNTSWADPSDVNSTVPHPGKDTSSQSWMFSINPCKIWVMSDQMDRAADLRGRANARADDHRPLQVTKP